MKKNIAIFTENLYGGGVEKILQNILRNFDYTKYDITLYSNREELLNDLYPNNISYKYIFETPIHFLLISKLVIKHQEREDYLTKSLSHAQADARVSSTERSAFQPNSSFARVGSAQIATTSPGRRSSNL